MGNAYHWLIFLFGMLFVAAVALGLLAGLVILIIKLVGNNK